MLIVMAMSLSGDWGSSMQSEGVMVMVVMGNTGSKFLSNSNLKWAP